MIALEFEQAKHQSDGHFMPIIKFMVVFLLLVFDLASDCLMLYKLYSILPEDFDIKTAKDSLEQTEDPNVWRFNMLVNDEIVSSTEQFYPIINYKYDDLDCSDYNYVCYSSEENCDMKDGDSCEFIRVYRWVDLPGSVSKVLVYLYASYVGTCPLFCTSNTIVYIPQQSSLEAQYVYNGDFLLECFPLKHLSTDQNP